MTKTLQNSINTKEERIIHLNLENKVLKSLNDQLKERNIKLKEDSCTQLRIITDQSRLVQEMSDIIATKTVFQHGSSGQISKFKRERSKLLSEIEQLKVQAASAKSRIRPRSMPAPPPPMALQFSRQRLCLEVFPTHRLTQEECSWTGSTARRHTSSPIKPKAVVVGSGQKKSGSETQIALIRQQETSSGGSKGDAKEWPLSGRASKSQYFDKIKIMRLKKDLFAAKSDLADKLCQLDDTEVKLREKTAEHVQACKVVEKLCKTIPELEKEISRLKRNSIVSDPGNPAKNAPIVDENQQPVTQDEYDAVVQRLRALQKKNESLIAKLTGGSTDRNENIIIKQLNEELIQARDETDKAQRWRKDCMDLCAISTARLEELAGFLDSLLRNKEFSGSLPVDRRKAMRKAVDRSLDLSRSLNMSISVTGFSLPESSLAHLSCLSGYLDAGEDSLLEANKENRADESVGSVAKVIETLKAENRELRGQLAGHNKKDVRRKIIPALAEPLSDSEAWSEPDRDVSQARIGLEERTSLPNSASKVKSVVTRGGVLQELSSTSENENVGYLKKHTAELKQLQETVGTLTGALQEKDSKILDVQSRLVDLDNKLQEERMKASRMQAELENTRQVNQRLEKENGVQQDRSKTNEKRLEELTREIQQKDEVLEKLRKEREQAFVDLRVAVMKLDNLRTEHQEVQQKHKDQIEILLAQERQRLEDLRRDLSESFNSQLKAKQASFEASLSESYISKNIHQEKLQELQEVMFRLDDTEMQLLGMSEDQARLKKQLQDAETAVQSMRKTLDETTLQASKAAIERTKALNEKRQLEDELKHCQDDLRATKEEKNALNAKLQEIQGQLQLATQQRTPPKRLNSSSGAEGSIASGYTSEELLLVTGRPAKPERTSRPENSSPDLGIESDAGRHSHTESQAPPPAPSPARPLLKTLELTRSMSNLLMEPKEEAIQELNPTSATTTTTPPHDCAKIEADYAELKRRYKQTRRHLELAYDSIKSANRRKERLEQDIKQQIQKTNVVLKTVRTNMTNELEKSPSGGEVRKSVP
ncbi:centrosomin (arrow protein) [Culex quinquefasciatus]|uniref:Centrosomin (Arrow protein) n=1 Tax=Culex quinquefasciatus TaxID=7176 RepID=B0WXU8_CULQU|nr:centrosomin (arrow protein) [Culex quinquefasciatus]|eukprot:XP_001862220.1 centrosomin (arrow protein) [Culex quinquefasciatus]